MFIQLNEHSDHWPPRRDFWSACALRSQVQFCYETTGAHDLLALFDCVSMNEFNELCDVLLARWRDGATLRDELHQARGKVRAVREPGRRT